LKRLLSALPAFPLVFLLFAPASVGPIGVKISDNAKYSDLKVICETYVPIFYYKLIQDDPETCVNGILNRGVSEYLDKHTRRLGPVDTTEEQDDVNDVGFGGIGVELTADKSGAIKVSGLVDGGTAESAGLRIDDLVVEVEKDGKFVPVDAKTNGNFKKAVNLIRGPVGDKVTIAITRNGARKELTVTRAKIVPKQVKYRPDLLPGKIGYVTINSFGSASVAKQTEAAIDAVLAKGARALILNVRNNPGGLLDEVEAIISLFEKDENAILVSIADYRKGAPTYKDHKVEHFGAKNYGKYAGIPVAVLINGNSASASEIFAAFLKYKGAVVVGTKTFCKGTVQTVFPLSSGGSIHLTTNEYFVGNPRIKVNDVCVTPDHEVKNAEDWNPRDEAGDLQLQKAVELLNKKP